jgi:hypothetical protein
MTKNTVVNGWNKERIQGILARVAEGNGTAWDAKFTLRALATVYANQTADEQVSQVTSHDNGTGFTGADAEILTSFAQQAERFGRLTPKQMALAGKRLGKYWKQLLLAIEAKDQATKGEEVAA